MKQAFIDYELHLQIYNEALWRYGEAHAKHEVGEPKKPEGYDVFLASQNTDNQIIDNKNKAFSYVEFVNQLEVSEKEKEQSTEKGINYDAEGIPEYLTADDYYNGRQNSAWVQKHEKSTLKPAIRPTVESEKLGINYDEDGIPEYLTAEARHFGEVNPAWAEKHEKK
jgi:hypothetical protein